MPDRLRGGELVARRRSRSCRPENGRVSPQSRTTTIGSPETLDNCAIAPPPTTALGSGSRAVTSQPVTGECVRRDATPRSDIEGATVGRTDQLTDGVPFTRGVVSIGCRQQGVVEVAVPNEVDLIGLFLEPDHRLLPGPGFTAHPETAPVGHELGSQRRRRTAARRASRHCRRRSQHPVRSSHL